MTGFSWDNAQLPVIPRQEMQNTNKSSEFNVAEALWVLVTAENLLTLALFYIKANTDISVGGCF